MTEDNTQADRVPTDGYDLCKAFLPNGTPVHRGDLVAVRERVTYEGGYEYAPGTSFRVAHLEFSLGDVQVGLDGGPLGWLAWEAFVNHIEANEFVLVTREGQDNSYYKIDD